MASGVALPGPVPGVAEATKQANTVTLRNKALAVSFDLSGSPAITSFRNLIAGKDEAVTQNNVLWSSGASVDLGALTLQRQGDIVIADAAVEANSATLANRLPGKTATATYRATATGFEADLVWTAELREDANYVRQHVAVKVISGTLTQAGSAPLQLGFLDVTVPQVRTTSPVDGSPVAAGVDKAETFFAGLEHPMAKNTIADNRVRQAVPSKKSYPANATFKGTTVLGVSQAGQLRRSSQFYIERERAHARRTFLHYQTWYDLKPNPEGTLVINSEKLAQSMELFGSQLTKRDAKLDSFWIDDGWDYLRAPRVSDESNLKVWSFDPT